MKLRTVLSELGATAQVLGAGVSLDTEVIVFSGEEAPEGLRELLMLAPEGVRTPAEGYQGITLFCLGTRLDGARTEVSERTVTFATPLARPEVERRFLAMPAIHARLDLQRKRIYRVFQTSYDVQQFANQLHEVLGNPLMVVNADRRLLASAGDFPENRADVLEEINQGYVSEEVNAEMEAAGVLDDVRHAGHSIISENERFGQRWVTSIITYHHMEMGRLDMLEQEREVTDVDLELVDFAGSLMAILIDKLGLAGRRAGSGSSVLEDILGNALVNEKTMRAQLALSGMPLDETYVVVVLAGERDLSRSHLQRMATQVSRAFRHSLWTMRNGCLVVMVALGSRGCAGWDAYGRAERVLGQRKEFLSVLSRNGLTAYVGEPFEQLSLAATRYQQAVDLRESGMGGTESIVYFWRYRFGVLSSLAQTLGQIDMMLDKRVVAMGLYDRDHGTAYLETACRTVEFPGSPAEAARALNVHRNTYFYRVNKILELFFLDLRNGEDRLAVSFSTKVLEGMGGNVLYDATEMPDGWKRVVGHGRAARRGTA